MITTTIIIIISINIIIKIIIIVIFFNISDYSGRITVPVFYDKVQKTIVSNESSEIIRMLNTEFNEFCPTIEQRELNLYPEQLRKAIDDVNEWIYS